jgi:hypothetical protein
VGDCGLARGFGHSQGRARAWKGLRSAHFITCLLCGMNEERAQGVKSLLYIHHGRRGRIALCDCLLGVAAGRAAIPEHVSMRLVNPSPD